jgi:hypothetical protein
MIESIKELIGCTLQAVGMLLWACFVMVLLACLGWGAYEVFKTTYTPEQQEARRLADIAEHTPHFYSKVDGCTVYIWYNDGHNHYFTKCDNTNKVITESNHSEYCGKACTKTVTEKIETN